MNSRKRISFLTEYVPFSILEIKKKKNYHYSGHLGSELDDILQLYSFNTLLYIYFLDSTMLNRKSKLNFQVIYGRIYRQM